MKIEEQDILLTRLETLGNMFKINHSGADIHAFGNLAQRIMLLTNHFRDHGNAIDYGECHGQLCKLEKDVVEFFKRKARV